MDHASVIPEATDPWTDAMRRGDFATAWEVCDAVLQRRRRDGAPRHAGPRHLQYVWDGTPVDGARVLVRCYHGLGDTLQFVRFLPRLRQRAREVILWAQPPLLPLLASARGIDRLLPLHDGAPDVDFDVDLELMELPHALRITLDDLPGPVPYLWPPRADSGDASDWPPRRDHGRHCAASETIRIGLTWRAGDWNPARSLSDAMLARLAGQRGVTWASVQFGVPAPSFCDEDLACADLAEQARRMQSLDLVVTVDTMTAHLAGALGLPVWTLLAEPSDWRWLRGDRSPWYPTMRLFRQSRAGDWQAPVTQLGDAVDAWHRARVARGEEFTVVHARGP
jgi:hypothetical protein